MKLRLFVLALYSVLLVSCDKDNISKCKDIMALNYQESSDCSYSTVTFYASTDDYLGDQVSEIELEINGKVIGTIAILNQSYPADCDAPGTLQYSFTNGDPQFWNCTYRLVAGGVVTHQQQFGPSSTVSCIRIDVLP